MKRFCPIHLRLSALVVAALGLAAQPVLAQQAAPAPAGVTVSVGLEDGVVDVKSTQGPMGLYREKVVKAQADDFEAFKRQITDGVKKEQDAFEKYKEQTQREFVGYVESVTMKAGTELVISGNTAVERQAAPKDNAARDFMKKWRAEDAAR